MSFIPVCCFFFALITSITFQTKGIFIEIQIIRQRNRKSKNSFYYRKLSQAVSYCLAGWGSARDWHAQEDALLFSVVLCTPCIYLALFIFDLHALGFWSLHNFLQLLRSWNYFWEFSSYCMPPSVAQMETALPHYQVLPRHFWPCAEAKSLLWSVHSNRDFHWNSSTSCVFFQQKGKEKLIHTDIVTN